MDRIIFIAQTVLAVGIAIAILMQNKGSGVSAIFGGTGGVQHQRRGLEKGLFTTTIILIILFIAINVYNLIANS